MEPREKTTPAPVAAKTGGSSFIKRELSGATFLTLEHVAHMVLVVVVTALLSLGIMNAIALWTGDTGALATSVFGSWTSVGGSAASYTQANASMMVVASLVVLVPLLVVLDRRTRAEWHKRSGYAGRLAYKMPVYAALGVLATVKVMAVVSMLTVVLSSLALIGVNGSGVGNMYLYEFLPALLSAILFGAAAWYLFRLAKGTDLGRTFSMAVAGLSALLVVALFITATVAFHKKPETHTLPAPATDSYDSDYYQDLLDKYYQ